MTDGGRTTAVVITAFNASSTIKATLESIAAQTFPLDEVIVVDDGSTDNTFELAQAFAKVLPLTIHKLPKNVGLLQAVKYGMNRTSADLLFRLDADDHWLPDHVESICAIKKKNPEISFMASIAVYFSAEKNELLHESRNCTMHELQKQLMWDNPLVHSSLAFDQHLYQQIGGYKLDAYNLDYDLIVRLARFGKFQMVSHPTVKYFIYPDSMSRSVGQRKVRLLRYKVQLKAIKLFFPKFPFRAFLIMQILILRAILLINAK